MSDFMAGLKRLHWTAGVAGEGVVLLLTDILKEKREFLVAINDLLSNGRVVGLFEKVRFRGRLVFKVHRPVYHSTLGSSLIKKEPKKYRCCSPTTSERERTQQSERGGKRERE